MYLSSSSPSLASRLQRISFLVGAAVGLLVFLMATAADLECVRHFNVQDFTNLVNAKATADSFAAARENSRKTERYLQEFTKIAGIKLVCLYGPDGSSTGEWHDTAFAATCPEFAIDSGQKMHWLDISISVPLQHDGIYLGMVYAAGRLVTLEEFMTHEAIIAAALILCILLIIFAMKKIMSRDMALQISAVHDQLECLKDVSRTDCTILPRNFTVEMAGMMVAISRLHDHYMNTMVSRHTLERSQRWHRQVFSHLLAALRPKIHMDSRLLHDLDDYTLIMQMEGDSMLPSDHVFDCSALLDSALADARRIQPPYKHVHLSISLQPGMSRFYAGQAESLEALLRHLLLIAFRRTKAGIILLRLIPEAPAQEAGRIMLRMELEDSGPHIQPGQLRRWLTPSSEDEVFASDENAVSWVLVTRLLQRLKGSVNAEPIAGGGLRLTALVPLLIALQPSAASETQAEISHISPPLLLIVEPENANHRKLIDACTHAGYRVFIVQDQSQTLEWSICLPVSAILLNMDISGSWQETAQRLRRQMHQHIMPHSDLWAFSASPSLKKSDQIDQTLSKPLRPEILGNLRKDVKAFDAGFYHMFDQTLRDDLPSGILARMPYMHQQLAKELESMKGMAETMARDISCKEAAQQAHAIKSLALSLGYFRIAALMTEVEHAALTRSFSHISHNWQIIAECLAQASALHQNPMARRAV